jgi:hypothetical protein
MLTRRSAYLGVFAALMVMIGLAPAARAADDATGTWKWSVPGRNGGNAREMSMKLKQDGEKLTGTISAGGQNARETEISDGKIKDGEISFKVVRKRQNNEITTKYTGKLSGDTIKGKSETDVNGTPRTNEFEAKRAKE